MISAYPLPQGEEGVRAVNGDASQSPDRSAGLKEFIVDIIVKLKEHREEFVHVR